MSKKVIKILGTGCPKCKRTINLVEEVVQEKNINADVIKVEDIMEIMEYNVLSTPVLVIDEEITVKGRVPSKDEVIELLTQ
ncbi:MAG TPA: thioredoxin family protein [Saprospiraceae bacterium]|nr:thioredoxin family protein [Saprospiraceae bacterium]